MPSSNLTLVFQSYLQRCLDGMFNGVQSYLQTQGVWTPRVKDPHKISCNSPYPLQLPALLSRWLFSFQRWENSPRSLQGNSPHQVGFPMQLVCQQIGWRHFTLVAARMVWSSACSLLKNMDKQLSFRQAPSCRVGGPFGHVLAVRNVAHPPPGSSRQHRAPRVRAHWRILRATEMLSFSVCGISWAVGTSKVMFLARWGARARWPFDEATARTLTCPSTEIAGWVCGSNSWRIVICGKSQLQAPNGWIQLVIDKWQDIPLDPCLVFHLSVVNLMSIWANLRCNICSIPVLGDSFWDWCHSFSAQHLRTYILGFAQTLQQWV